MKKTNSRNSSRSRVELWKDEHAWPKSLVPDLLRARTIRLVKCVLVKVLANSLHPLECVCVCASVSISLPCV